MDKELITRQELYDLVWSVPLTTLAKRYGLSDNGLRKICKRTNIPLPKAGHWMKLQFNKKVQIIPLPKSGEDETTITFPLRDLEEVNQRDEMTKEIKASMPPVSVPQRLTQPDPLVVQAKQSLLSENESSLFRLNGMVRCGSGQLDIVVTLKNVGRALRFMDALIKALYSRGMK